MNLENIIICVICLAAIAVSGYFLYSKVTIQNQELIKLSKRCEAIETLFARPPPQDDIQAMYIPKYNNMNRQPETSHKSHTVNPSPQSPLCESAMCDLEPLHIATNEEELDHIVNAELNKVIETEEKKTQTNNRQE
jgi:hypothetical protein